MEFWRSIFWHQGQFLQPQHFQYNDLAMMAHIQNVQTTQSPHPWGVVKCKFDKDALNRDFLDILSGEFIFPDGTFISINKNALVKAKNFPTNWKNQSQTLKCYIGIKRNKLSDNAITKVESKDDMESVRSRYVCVSKGSSMPDIFEPNVPEVSLETLYISAEIFFGDEITSNTEYESLPIAQLKYDGDKVVQDSDYVAPSMFIQSSPDLSDKLVSLRGELVNRARQFEEYKGGSSSNDNKFSPKAIRYRMALQVLSRYAPLLAHYVADEQVLPWVAYGTLRQLIGELSVFSDQVDIMGQTSHGKALVGDYDHKDIGGVFNASISLIKSLLNDLTIGPDLFVPFDVIQQGHYSATIPNAFLQGREDLYLCIRTERDFDSLIESFTKFSKVSSKKQIEILSRLSLPSLALTYQRVKPEGLPNRPNASYFLIDKSDENWRAIESELVIELLWADAPEDLKVDIVAVRR